MVEEIGQITNQRAETVLEEPCLVAFFVCCFAVDVPVREEVAKRGRGSNLNMGQTGNVV